MHIVSLVHATKEVTGGQKYNNHLEDTMERLSRGELVRYLQPYERYGGVRKLFAWLLELRFLWEIRRGDMVLMGDTLYRYHLLLMILLRWKKCRTVLIVHHFCYLEYRGWKRQWKEWVMTLYGRMAGVVLVPSLFTRAVAEEKYGKDKVCYVPLPFDLKFDPSPTYIPNQLLYVGTIEPRKGLHFLPEVVDCLLNKHGKHVQVMMVGRVMDENYDRALRARISDLGLDGQFIQLGQLSKEELNKLYAESEIFVFPSQLEGFGMVIVEAMSHGTPVVAFDNSAMPYSIRPMENSLLAKNADAEKMADEIAGLLGNESLRAKLQKGMRNTIEALATEEVFCRATADFIRKQGCSSDGSFSTEQ